MKIAIIDDYFTDLEIMARLSLEAGHQTLLIYVSTPSFRKRLDDLVAAGNGKIIGVTECEGEKIAQHVKAFVPDRVFLDHNLGINADTDGEGLTDPMGVPKEKLIGTSSLNPQNYCITKFRLKTQLEIGSPSAKDEFKRFLK